MAISAVVNAGSSTVTASTAVAGVATSIGAAGTATSIGAAEVATSVGAATATTGLSVGVGVAVVATLVVSTAAVATGVVASDREAIISPLQVGLVCPNVIVPEMHRGLATIDFIVPETYLVPEQADRLGGTFQSAYNLFLGCDSKFSRVTLNCFVPCEKKEDENETAINERHCCYSINDEKFGNLTRCPFVCTVHCVGCNPFEPLVRMDNVTNGTDWVVSTFPSAAPSNSSSPTGAPATET
jgi:hypothetical protein